MWFVVKEYLEVVVVEGGAWIGFAFWCNLLMCGDVFELWVCFFYALNELGKVLVLFKGVGIVVASIEFYAYGVVVAVVAVLVARFSSMPCAVVRGDVLGDFAVACDVEMRGDF